MILSGSNLTDSKICAQCELWEAGDFWGTGNGKHGVLVECKGWCHLKKTKRKRWNYHAACDSIVLREQTGIIFHGCGEPTEEDIGYIVEQIGKLLHNGEG